MKKIYTTLLFLTMIATITKAQLTYGPRLAMNVSKFDNEKVRLGFGGGWFMNAELLDRIGIQPEVYWSFKNGHTETGAGDSLIQQNYHYRFVDLPLLLYFRISNHLDFLIGPQWSFSRYAHQVTVTTHDSHDSNLGHLTTQRGFMAGIDVNLGSSFSFGVRYNNNKWEQKTEQVGPFNITTPNKLGTVMVTCAYKLDW